MEQETLSSESPDDVSAKPPRTEVRIPAGHQHFVDLSASHYGVQQKARNFITAFHQPDISRLSVIEQLRQILLQDLWFYSSLPNPQEAYEVLIDICDGLLQSDLTDDLREKVFQTLLEFVGDLSVEKNTPDSSMQRSMEILGRFVAADDPLAIRNSRYFKSNLAGAALMPQFSAEVFALTRDVLQKGIQFWGATVDAKGWLKQNAALIQKKPGTSISQIDASYFDQLRVRVQSARDWDSLKDIPTFDDIASRFRRFADQLDTPLYKINYILFLLRLPGMGYLAESLLRDIDQLLREGCGQLPSDRFIPLIEQLFDIFETLRGDHTNAILDCALTLGKGAVGTGEQSVVDVLQTRLIRFGFISPGPISITDNWQVQIDVNHIKNIRVYIELIECEPSMMRRLLSALIVNIRLDGVFLSDTDLFQRDITRLLNSEISPFYKQIKQLCRLFPIYFNGIGAVGELREVTTALDELSQRRDRLIHFFRKQTHAESNSTHIELARKILQFWYDGDITSLETLVPPDVIETIDQQSEWFLPMHDIVQMLCREFKCEPQQLLELDTGKLEIALSYIAPDDELNKKRLLQLIRIYWLLQEKYSLQPDNIVKRLRKYGRFDDEEIATLAASLQSDATDPALNQVFGFMKKLNDIILDPNPTQGWENIDRKRHIAAGMASMYGEYREPKFEAMGLVLRLEKMAAALMGDVIEATNLEYVTVATLRRIYHVLTLFEEGLKLDGIYSQSFSSNLRMLEFSLISASFSLEQYVNIFQFLEQDVKGIINQYFLNIYDEPLRLIIRRRMEKEDAVTEGLKSQMSARVSEEFYRGTLSAAFLVQDLDNFLSTAINTLHNTLDKYPRDVIQKVMSYDPELIVSPLCEETPRMDNQVFLGSKAYFLKKLISLGFPVPPGFVLTTEMFRHKDAMMQHDHILQEVDRFIHKHIAQLEKVTGCEFGNPNNPLLLSARAGAAFSMPGAMTTFLNVGMNDEIAEALSHQPNFAWGAWDCYRRLLHCWGMAYGIERDIFDKIVVDFKSRHDVAYKAQFSPDQMKEMVYQYKQVLQSCGIPFEQDPFLQLKQAIGVILDSWSLDLTKTYREHMQIADEWGTAVLIQKMVLGNKGPDSGSGVLFTHDPYGGKSGINLYGDFTVCSQGEDIVSGMVYPLPITEYHRQKHTYEADTSLESDFPRIYEKLVDFATQLVEKHGFRHQEIEFTFESDKPEDLYLLQTRAQAIQKREKRAVFDASQDEMQLVGRGIGIGGGALSGLLAIDADDLQFLAKRYPNQKRILVRPDTVPDDIPMIFESDGLLTGRGGATSHASVTAVRLGKVCVVGCRDLIVNDLAKSCKINGVIFNVGDWISIEGFLGNIYAGNYPTRYVEEFI